MTDTEKLAVEYHRRGCNCAQAVLVVIGTRHGLDFATAMRVAGGLGAGFRCGDICGAAASGVMIIGLEHAAVTPEDLAQKNLCYAKTTEFLNAFRSRFGSTQCRELLKEKGRAVCDSLIAGSVALLTELGY